MKSQEKTYRQLSEEELEKVSGGAETLSVATQKCVAENKQKREQELGRILTWEEDAEIHKACVRLHEKRGIVI